MTSVIRKADTTDIPAIVSIYDAVLRMEEAGKYSIGWIRGVYPTQETAEAGVGSGDMFVLEEEGRITASARINHEQMPAYTSVSWSVDVPDEEVMVMHTLTVHPDMHGHGAGDRFIRFYEDYSLSHGSHVLRIDTNERNLNARRKYALAGYTERGTVPCEFNGISGVRLVCLEKVLRQ